MPHQFLLCQPHAKCPELMGWYLDLRPDDLKIFFQVHRGVCCLYFHKFRLDPHIKPGSLQAALYTAASISASTSLRVKILAMPP
jgi:hypothetical protein